MNGSDGPLIASFERAFGDDVWQLVLTAPDGATRVAAELGLPHEPVRSTAEPREPRPSRFSESGVGVAFDAVGSQVIVAGLAVDGSTDEPDVSPTVLLLDLADGEWARLPVEADVTTFVRADSD